MTPRERLLTVLHGEIPDVVPWFADLSNWFNAERKQRFVPSQDKDLDYDMIEICKEAGAGIYIELGGIIDTVYEGDVEEKQRIEGDTFYWTLKTPVGQIQEVRTYNEQSFSWDIIHRMVRNIKDVEVVRYAMERRRFIPRFDKYDKMVQACGEYGLPYACGVPYSGLGFFISRFMGVENTIYALHDFPKEMGKTIELTNRVNMKAIDCLCGSPAEVILISDNLSSDVQSPALFQKHSAWYYSEAAKRIHNGGKYFAVHLDGRIRGLLSKLAACEVDIADALTPKPTGDMTPQEIRAEGGIDIILSGGISPVYWSPDTSEKDFIAHVKEWLNLRTISPRLIMSDGDQTPPGTSFQRIKLMKNIVEEYGRF